jgi:nucleoside-diphosphate-sugar epimerase
VAQALFLSITTPNLEGLTFNLAGDVRPTVVDYMQRIAAATHRPFRFIPRPVWQIQARELLFYAIKYIVRRGNVSFPPLRDFSSLAMSAPLDCSLAKKVLGWQPCADPGEFYRQALLPHLTPLHPDDIRLEV